MALWTDLFEPSELTGYARASLEAYEERQGSLARWLPNADVDDTHVAFNVEANGLVEAAEFRAFDAEPSIGRDEQGKSLKIELPALGQKRLFSEYRSLRLRNASDEAYRSAILKALDNTVKAIANRMEMLRGTVLDSGKATVDQRNYKFDDDFGRPAGHTVTAAALWSSATSVDRIQDLINWTQTYTETNNGETPGSTLMSTAVWNVLRAGDQFVDASTGRPMTLDAINGILVSEGVPPIYLYDRRIKSYEGVTARVTRADQVLLLPEPGNSDLGNTFWGTTLTATELDWGIADDERAGIVAGIVKSDNVPVRTEIVADAIGMPVLGNAAKSFAAKVV